jgi:hypothetical protein
MEATMKTELTTERLETLVPSAFSTEHHSNRTDQYKVVPTSKIITSLREANYLPVSASQLMSQSEETRLTTKHTIRFRHKDYFNTLSVGDYVPEIGLINSHNGYSCVELFFGLFRCWCDNQCVVEDSRIGSIKLKHVGSDTLCEDVIQGADKLISKTPIIIETIGKWEATRLDEKQKMDFATKASMFRGKTLDVKPEQLLQSRRRVDSEDDNLWKTFNRVQENLIRGGVDGLTNNGRRRVTKAIKSIDSNMKINRQLWALAQNYQQN